MPRALRKLTAYSFIWFVVSCLAMRGRQLMTVTISRLTV